MNPEYYSLGLIVVYLIFFLVIYDQKMEWFGNGWFLLFMFIAGTGVIITEHMVLKNKDMVEERAYRIDKI